MYLVIDTFSSLTYFKYVCNNWYGVGKNALIIKVTTSKNKRLYEYEKIWWSFDGIKIKNV